MVEKYPYTKRLDFIKKGAGAEYIKDEYVEPDKRLVLTHITVLDECTVLTKIRIGKETAGYFHIWEEEPSPVVNVAYHSEKIHLVRTGERFEAELTGGLKGDVCIAFLDGYWYYYKKGD